MCDSECKPNRLPECLCKHPADGVSADDFAVPAQKKHGFVVYLSMTGLTALKAIERTALFSMTDCYSRILMGFLWVPMAPRTHGEAMPQKVLLCE